LTADRTYWSLPGRAWHAYESGAPHNRAVCGRYPKRLPKFADRIPADGHLCGSCSRVVLARTDVEGVPV